MSDGKGEVYVNGYHASVFKGHNWRTAENSCQHLLPALRELAQSKSFQILLRFPFLVLNLETFNVVHVSFKCLLRSPVMLHSLAMSYITCPSVL